MKLEQYKDIFEFVKAQETAFNQSISIYDEFDFNFKQHIKQSLFYLFGRLMTGNKDEKNQDKPVKNIIRRILRFRYAAEDIDVKDVNIYVDDSDKYHLSFLVKKYHDEVFIKENKLDKFFDSVKKEKINFGGSLTQRMNGVTPKKVSLQNIAFCDQSDIMNAPFGIKIPMSVSELMEMEEKGWGEERNGATISINELIGIASYKRQMPTQSGTNKEEETPGKYVEIYQVWGVLPAEFVGGKEGKYSLQLHYITFTMNPEKPNDKIGYSLFSMEDKDKKRFKFIKQDDGDGLEGRALGYGGVEELFEAQAWTNASMIWKMDMLRAASKIIMQTADSALVKRHPTGLKDLDNLEVLEHEEGKPLTQVDTFPRNYQHFMNLNTEWETYAQQVSFATDPLLGEEAPSGTPFRAQERQVIQGKMPHEENVKEFARFIKELYEDWVIPHIAKEITKGTKFLSELSADELEFVANNAAIRETNKAFIEDTLNGILRSKEEYAASREQIKVDFLRKGNKRFLEILKDELKNASLKVHVDVASKNKDLGLITDKLSNIFKMVFSNPAILNDPRAAKVFRKILEYSGLNQIDFTADVPIQQVQQPQLAAGTPQVVPQQAVLT